MKESSIEARIVLWAKKQGIFSLKLGGQHNRGKADRLFMRNGKTVFMEVKAPGREATPLQEKFMAERRAYGFPAECFDNAPLAMEWLKKHLLQ